jgi:hypothetical protein
MKRKILPRTFCIVAIAMLLGGSADALARQGNDTAFIDAYIARVARGKKGEEYKEARKVLEGDVNHDGVADVVVLYTVEALHGNGYEQDLAVFVRTNGKLVATANAIIGGKMSRSVDLVSIAENTIKLDTLNYGPKDPACCPTVKGHTSYVLVGRQLREFRH